MTQHSEHIHVPFTENDESVTLTFERDGDILQLQWCIAFKLKPVQTVLF